MKWLAVATITNVIKNGYSSHSTLDDAIAREPRERPADHQREGDVHRGHGGIEVGERRGRAPPSWAVSMCTPVKFETESMKPHSGMNRGGAVGNTT